MSLTTKDIYEMTFKRSKKGFDEDEVDKFLDQIIDELKAKQNEIDSLKEEIKVVRDLETNIKGTEDTIMNTLVSAQKSSERILREAARKAELLIDNAENTAKQKSESMKHELIVLERKLAAIKQSAYNYAMSFTEMVNIQATSFEKTYQSYFGDMDAYSSGGINFDALERIDNDISKDIEEIVSSDTVDDAPEKADQLAVEWNIPDNDENQALEAQEPLAPMEQMEELVPLEKAEVEPTLSEKAEEESIVFEKVEEEEPTVFEKVAEEEPEKLEKVDIEPEEPVAEEPVAEEPAAEEPAAEEPADEEPAADEPKAEEPKAEEPKAEEQKAEEPAEERKPVDGMPLNEINQVLTDIEVDGDEPADADKTKFDDYSWLYGEDEKKEKSDFELSFKDPKEGQELKSLIDDVIE